MVYDEPSASLDVETESELLRQISLSGKDRICVLISHRMLRSDIADRIVVIEKGRIAEQGNHDELVTLGGRYAHLWKTYHRLGSNELNSDIAVVDPTLQVL
jgi:ATP-binding cassette subfamily B protein